jgi:hypothetical protein
MLQVLEPLDVFDSPDINSAITALDAEVHALIFPLWVVWNL